MAAAAAGQSSDRRWQSINSPMLPEFGAESQDGRMVHFAQLMVKKPTSIHDRTFLHKVRLSLTRSVSVSNSDLQ